MPGKGASLGYKLRLPRIKFNSRERRRWKVGEEKGFVYSPRWLLLYCMNLPLVPVQFHSNNPTTHSFATRQQLFLLATSCSFVKFFEMWAYWGLKFQILIFSSAPAFITLIFYRPQFVILRVDTIIIMYDTIYILSSQVRTYMACISASFMAWQPNRHTNTHDWTWTELDTWILDWTTVLDGVCIHT